MTLETHPSVDMDVEYRIENEGPFVINLRASTAPIGLPTNGPAGGERTRLYQIQRVDDGRVRYRLRLGPFATEHEAEAILGQVRLEYPGALIATAAADDLHAIALVRGKANTDSSPVNTRATDAGPPTSTAPAVAVAAPPVALAAPAVAVAAPAPAVAARAPAPAVAAAAPAVAVGAPAIAVAAPAVAGTEPAIAGAAPIVTVAATAVAPAVAVAAPAAALAAAAPAVAVAAPVIAVAAPAVAVPARALAVAAPAVSVASDIASMQALIAAIDTAPRTATPRTAPRSTAALSTAPAKPPALHPAPAAKMLRREPARAGTPASSLESTQTLRPLTRLELGENEAPRWFVVQLGLSDDAFDPDALPHLDIFSLYRLYTVNGLDQGRPVHALRLGFFAEEAGARAVAGYLAAFYREAAVKRVSVAERDRFADQRVEARKDVGATGRHLAIEITGELVVRARRS